MQDPMPPQKPTSKQVPIEIVKGLNRLAQADTDEAQLAVAKNLRNDYRDWLISKVEV